MRVNVGRIRKITAQARQRAGVDVGLHWKNVSGGVLDVTTGDVVGAVEADQQATERALVDYVRPGDRRLEMFQAYEVNDVIIDFREGVELDGKQALYFEIEGRSYAPKDLGDSVPHGWNAVVNGKRIWRTVLARLKT